jgi:hypothetical protein
MGSVMTMKAEEPRFKFSEMRQDELTQVMEILDNQITVLKKTLGKYKEGVNPEHGEIKNKMEELEGERAMAYKVWSERHEAGLLH